VEASGSYSWLVDEMERSGHRPKLANPLEAKRRMGLTKKTDQLDAKGLAIGGLHIKGSKRLPGAFSTIRSMGPH
jgi:hypothetical protein